MLELFPGKLELFSSSIFYDSLLSTELEDASSCVGDLASGLEHASLVVELGAMFVADIIEGGLVRVDLLTNVTHSPAVVTSRRRVETDQRRMNTVYELAPRASAVGSLDPATCGTPDSCYQRL